MRWYILLLFFIISINASAQMPVNDNIANAINIANPNSFCTDDAFYNNINATVVNGSAASWGGNIGKDVWFKFTATKFDVNINIGGRTNGASLNTMLNPLVALYIFDQATNFFTEIPGTMLSSNNVTSLYKGALTIGQIYYIRVSAANDNEGSFKLCVDNYFPPIVPGQDCSTASVLYDKLSFTQTNVGGTGLNNHETAGTCLGTESNSVWYKWTVSKSGTLTFLIEPTVITNDIDWVLYDLGPNGDCGNITAANAIRCASGSGVNCNPAYHVTGMSFEETDLSETSGCPVGKTQNGLVKFVDMVVGNNYALIIDNFSGGNNGFHIDFEGTAEFAGPKSVIKMDVIDECKPEQSYNFTSLSTNYKSLKWTFGEGASIATSTDEGPINVTYSTQGEKIVVLEAFAFGGGEVVSTEKFYVAVKPSLPSITYSTIKLCPGNNVTLQTPNVKDATYHWTGPNGFTSNQQNPELLITGPENSGDYHLFIKVGNCVSDVATVNIPSIDLKPEALFDILANFKCTINQSFTFINNSKNYTSVDWNFGANASSTLLPNGNREVVFSTYGIHEITLTVYSESGCVSTLTKQIEVQLKPALPVITSNQKAFCLGDVIRLSIPESEGLRYFWTGPNNFTATTSSIEIPVANFNLAGIYRIHTQIGECESDIASITIPPIAKVPVAAFGTDPLFNSKFTTPLPIVFKNNSKDADSYFWNFGDGNSSNEANPKHTYIKSGKYKVKLTAYADEGCSNSTEVGDLIILDAALFVPNTFSPNGDGINDEFVVTVLNLKKYQLLIYNRNGESIFQTYNIYENWKGTRQNQDVPVGTYYYIILGKNVYNQDVKYTGSLTLIR
ncbi:MAG: PKD domain-containing protein [Pedobacter sp.]|jgi:gliding motility-associated-like protein